jgi:hypothetical protein
LWQTEGQRVFKKKAQFYRVSKTVIENSDKGSSRGGLRLSDKVKREVSIDLEGKSEGESA